MTVNTKFIMAASAVFLGAIGICLIFVPKETAGASGQQVNDVGLVVIQILGGLYFSFAIINWMAKGAAIGGIYNKPILMDNLTHFAITAITLMKAILKISGLPYSLYLLTGVYTFFAILFGLMFFRGPIKEG